MLALEPVGRAVATRVGGNLPILGLINGAKGYDLSLSPLDERRNLLRPLSKRAKACLRCTFADLFNTGIVYPHIERRLCSAPSAGPPGSRSEDNPPSHKPRHRAQDCLRRIRKRNVVGELVLGALAGKAPLGVG
jgi:hypothetical protein